MLSPCAHSEIFIFFFLNQWNTVVGNQQLYSSTFLLFPPVADPEIFPGGGGLGVWWLFEFAEAYFWQFYNVIEFCRSNDLSPLDLGMCFNIAWMIEHTMHTMGGNSHLQQLWPDPAQHWYLIHLLVMSLGPRL